MACEMGGEGVEVLRKIAMGRGILFNMVQIWSLL